MSWLEKLSQTYDNCTGRMDAPDQADPLLPICHTTQNAHIEVVIDITGTFRRARVLVRGDDKTIIPCTEASGGRAGSKPTSHPLCDKLQYLAGDFLQYGGDVTSGFSAKPTEPHEVYLALLSAWCESSHRHPKIAAVLAYVKKGTVIADLCQKRVLFCDRSGKNLLKSWDDASTATPEIFRILPTGNPPEAAFVRWSVEAPGDPESRLWLDETVWQSWINYYSETKASPGLCFATGKMVPLATQHPAKLRHAADKAKLISANDSSGFTFRGRFTDTDGSQACGVSFEVTQKAHNALRWLIARQGRRDGDQAIVAWAPSGKAIPRLDHDSNQFLYDGAETAPADSINVPTASTHAHVAQAFALRLKKKIGGYQAELGDAADIVVLALDSATPGRMAITFYRELRATEFLQRIEAWHTESAWHQNYGKSHVFVGAPAPRDIAEVAYGRRLDDKLLAATCRRLLPCIIDAIPIPRDLVDSCVRRASNRTGLEPWEWEKTLGIACALYRKQTINEKNYLMALEPHRTDRDYLYGRLLALAERLESYALYLAGENRATNAARLMQRFADHPCDTWRTLYLALDPYRARLRTRRPATLHFLETEIDSIVTAFAPEEFTSSEKLGCGFLLGYHCQRAALKAKPEAKDQDDQDSSTNETETN
jgi:CRISPR-associated protein Csd1